MCYSKATHYFSSIAGFPVAGRRLAAAAADLPLQGVLIVWEERKDIRIKLVAFQTGLTTWSGCRRSCVSVSGSPIAGNSSQQSRCRLGRRGVDRGDKPVPS